MEKDYLLKELNRIVNIYVENETQRDTIKQGIEKSKVKYILGEVEKYRTKDFTASDKEIIKDIYFHFC